MEIRGGREARRDAIDTLTLTRILKKVKFDRGEHARAAVRKSCRISSFTPACNTSSLSNLTI